MKGASLVKLTIAAGVGATIAYVFDPVRGRRRRAELKDRGHPGRPARPDHWYRTARLGGYTDSGRPA